MCVWEKMQRSPRAPKTPGHLQNKQVAYTDYPSTLPGVHLPKSASEWEEANSFFRAAFSAAPFLSIENLDDFTNIFQSTMYNDFAENYGTTSERKTDEKKLDAMSVKELKKKLSCLKKGE